LCYAQIIGEEMDTFVFGTDSLSRAAVKDEPFRIEHAARDAVLGNRTASDDLDFAVGRIGADNPIALVVILVVGDARRAAMRREVEPTVVAEIEPAVNLAGRVMAVG